MGRDGRYSVTQADIDNLVANELENVRFTVHPVYNPQITKDGKTVAEYYQWGDFKRITKIEIGRQSVSTKKYLLDTLVHEELEARIMSGKNRFYRELMQRNVDAEIHGHIYTVIEKYFTMKGW